MNRIEWNWFFVRNVKIIISSKYESMTKPRGFEGFSLACNAVNRFPRRIGSKLPYKINFNRFVAHSNRLCVRAVHCIQKNSSLFWKFPSSHTHTSNHPKCSQWLNENLFLALKSRVSACTMYTTHASTAVHTNKSHASKQNRCEGKQERSNRRHLFDSISRVYFWRPPIKRWHICRKHKICAR